MNKKNIFRLTLYFILLISLMFPLISQAQDIIQDSPYLSNAALCMDVEENEPIFETASFRTWDKKAVCWIRFNYQAQNPFMITWEWIDPVGRIYHVGEIEMEAGYYQGYRTWYWISIIDHYAAKLPGEWKVRIYIDNTLLSTKDFRIGS